MLVIMLLIELPPNEGGGDMGGGGSAWNPREGSAPCRCPYMLGLLVGVALGVEFAVCGRVAVDEVGVGLVVRDLGGGGGGGGDGGRAETGLELGMDGSELVGGCGRACGAWGAARPRMREALAESVGEWPGETGDSGPLAVFALRLGAPDECAERRLGLLGDGYGES